MAECDLCGGKGCPKLYRIKIGEYHLRRYAHLCYQCIQEVKKADTNDDGTTDR